MRLFCGTHLKNRFFKTGKKNYAKKSSGGTLPSQRKGFTFLEALVTILIFGFIVAGMYGIMMLAKTNYDINLVQLNLHQQTRQAMNWISRQVRESYWPPAISAPDANSNNSITFNTPDAAIGTVTYSVTSTLVSGHMLWQLECVDSTGTKIRGNDITGLTITNPRSHTLSITLTAKKSFYSGGKEHTLIFPLTEQVEVRN